MIQTISDKVITDFKSGIIWAKLVVILLTVSSFLTIDFAIVENILSSILFRLPLVLYLIIELRILEKLRLSKVMNLVIVSSVLLVAFIPIGYLDKNTFSAINGAIEGVKPSLYGLTLQTIVGSLGTIATNKLAGIQIFALLTIISVFKKLYLSLGKKLTALLSIFSPFILIVSMSPSVIMQTILLFTALHLSFHGKYTAICCVTSPMISFILGYRRALSLIFALTILLFNSRFQAEFTGRNGLVSIMCGPISYISSIVITPDSLIHEYPAISNMVRPLKNFGDSTLYTTLNAVKKYDGYSGFPEPFYKDNVNMEVTRYNEYANDFIKELPSFIYENFEIYIDYVAARAKGLKPSNYPMEFSYYFTGPTSSTARLDQYNLTTENLKLESAYSVFLPREDTYVQYGTRLHSDVKIFDIFVNVGVALTMLFTIILIYFYKYKKGAMGLRELAFTIITSVLSFILCLFVFPTGLLTGTLFVPILYLMKLAIQSGVNNNND